MPEQQGEKLCPICDSPLQPGSKKCGFCGTDLALFESETEPAKVQEAAKAPVEVKTEEPPVAEPTASPTEAEPKIDSKVEEVFFGPAETEQQGVAKSEEPPVSVAPVSPQPEPEAQPEPTPAAEQMPEAEPEPAQEAVSEQPVEEQEHFECPQCGAKVPATANTCSGCGAMFAEEGAEMFQCPACEALVSTDASTCPGCGAMFVEPAEAEAASTDHPVAEAEPQPRTEPESEAEIEPQVATVPEKPTAEMYVEAPPEEGADKKSLFGGLFGKRKRKGPEPEIESDSVLRIRKPSLTEPSERAEVEHPVQTFEGAERTPPTAVPQDSTREKSKGKELAKLTAEIQPLMHLAISRGVEVSESRRLVDAGAVSVRARQLDNALQNVTEAQRLLTLKLQENIEQLKADLNQEVKVAKELGGDVSRTRAYLEQLNKADASGDFEAVYIYADKVKNELMPITGRYNESKEKLAALKGLLADSEMISANTRETRLMLTEATKSFETNEFDKVDAMVKEATKRLYQEIDPRMEDEIRRARNQLVELKARDINITPMITVLKSARTLMLSKDYAQALKELREFKEQIRKAE